MRRRLHEALLGVGLFALLAGTADGRGERAQRVACRERRTTSASSTRAPGCSPPTARSTSRASSYGLQYATNGTNKVNGKTINLTLADDKTDPATGVSAMQGPDRPGLQDHRRHRRPRASRCRMAPLAAQNHVLFISGPAAADAITGLNKYTFRSGRQTLPGRRRPRPRYLEGQRQEGRRLRPGLGLRPGQLRRGQGGPRRQGPHGLRALVPLTATDFTPFAQQAKHANPDLLFVAWAGTTAGAMWKALDQQGVFAGDERRHGPRRARDLAELGDRRRRSSSSRTTSTGAEEQGERLARHADAQAAARCRTSSRRTASSPAQMIVHALQKGDERRSDKMISALEGWKFLAPKGIQAIRPQDHAMLQPMFRVQLVQEERHGSCRRCSAPPRRSPDGAARRGRCGARRATDDSGVSASPILATSDLGLDIGGATIVADVSLEVARGRVARRDRPERRRQDVAVQPALGPAAGRRPAASCSTATTSPASRRTAGRGSGSAARSRSRTCSRCCPCARTCGSPRRRALGGTMRIWRRAARVREALERADWALERVGLGAPRSRRSPARSRTATSASSSSRCCSPATRA